MTFKQLISLNSKLISVAKKKFLNRIFFNKSYLREFSHLDGSEMIVDNYSLFDLLPKFTIKVKKVPPFFKPKTSLSLKKKKVKKLSVTVGNSIHSEFFTYRHQLDDFYQFNSTVYSFLAKLPINQYLLRLNKCCIVQNFKHHLFFLSPKRGGFLCYYAGFKGFMPSKHGLLIFKRFLINVKKILKLDELKILKKELIKTQNFDDLKNLRKILKKIGKLKKYNNINNKFFLDYFSFFRNLKKHFFFRFNFLELNTTLRRHGRYRRKFVHKKLKFAKTFKKKKIVTKAGVVFLSYKKMEEEVELEFLQKLLNRFHERLPSKKNIYKQTFFQNKKLFNSNLKSITSQSALKKK